MFLLLLQPPALFETERVSLKVKEFSDFTTVN